MIIISLIVAGILVAVDQIIKRLAEQTLIPGDTTPVIKFGDTEVFNLTYCENRGAAFSIFSGKQTFLIILTIIVMIMLTVFLLKTKNKSKFFYICYTLIIAGGIGNLIDRITQGYVVDYIEFRLFKFAIFNFADICVVIGGILLFICVLFDEKNSGKKRDEKY